MERNKRKMKIKIEKNRVAFRNTYYDFSMNRDFIYFAYCNEKFIRCINWIYDKIDKNFINISKKLHNKKYIK